MPILSHIKRPHPSQDDGDVDGSSSEGEGEDADEYVSSRLAIAKNVIGGVRLLP